MDKAIPPTRTRKARGDGPSRRGEILEAAKRLFLEQGVEQVTMRRIASQVGVSPTALYVYFPDKEAILQAIAEAMFAELVMAHARTQEREGTPLERFRAGLRAYIELGLARDDEYRLTFSTVRTTNACRSISGDRSFEALEGGVAELMAAGIFVHKPVTLVAEAIWAALHGMVVLLLDHAGHLESGPGELIDTLLDMLLRGLSIQPDHC